MVLELFKKIMSLVLSENGLKWKYLRPFNIFGKLCNWENSGSQVKVQNPLNQSYLSILTSTGLVNQISLSVCWFFCLSVSLYVPPFLEIDWIFYFGNFVYGHLSHYWGGHKYQKIHSYHPTQRKGAFLVIFTLFFFYVPLCLKNGFFVKFSLEILWRSLYPDGHYTKISRSLHIIYFFVWGHFKLFLDSLLWFVFLYFLRTVQIFSHNLLCKCF